MKGKIDAFESVPGCFLKAGGTRRVCGGAGDRCLGVCGWAVSADWGSGLEAAGRGMLSLVASPSHYWGWWVTTLQIEFPFFKQENQTPN